MHPNIHHKHMRAHTLYKLTDQLFSFADEATPLHGETGPNSTSILESSSFSTDDLPRMLKSKSNRIVTLSCNDTIAAQVKQGRST